MKKILLVLFSLSVSSVYSQLLGYGDLGVVITQQNKQGTARSMAMSDAFGALGGDLSAITINPAGSAVFNTSYVSGTFGYNEWGKEATFYQTTTQQMTENFALAQIGAALVFENNTESSDFRKFVFGVNYQKTNTFKNNWKATGISLPTWSQNYFNSSDTNLYSHVNSQTYTNKTSGKQTELNLNLSTDISNKLFLGASLNSHSFEWVEDATRHELANDGNGHTVDAFESFWQEVTGEGVSVSLGLIYKPIPFVRLGLSYNSPVWYDVTEYNNMLTEFDGDYLGYYDVLYSVDPPAYTNSDSKSLTFDYQMRSPSKATASLAFVFGKTGLLSADFSRKNFSKIHLSPETSFIDDDGFDYNKDIAINLKESYSLNIGTEWRLQKLSVRGGYSYEQTPYKVNIETDNKQGYSFGVGYNFGYYSIDVGYQYTENTDYLNFYSDISSVPIKGADLLNTHHKVNATFSFKF